MARSDLTALLERLPEIKADDFSELDKYKRWWLRQTDEYFEKRNARRRVQRRKNKWPSDNKEASRARSKKQYLRLVGRLLTKVERHAANLKREAAKGSEKRSAAVKKGHAARSKNTES